MNKGIKKVLIDQHSLQDKVKEIGDRINLDYKGKNLLLLCILKGSIMFMSDLMKYINIDVEVEFMSVSSYGNSVVSSGSIRILKDLDMSVDNRNILIVEDIIDTGITLNYICNYLKGKNATSVEVATLLNKPSGRKVHVEARYIGFEIGSEFVVGYGLDYAEKYRNLPYIGILDESMYK